MPDLEPTDIPKPKSIPIWLWAALTVLPIVVSVITTMLTSRLDWFKETNSYDLETRKLDFQLLQFGVGVLSTAPETSDNCTNYYAKKWAMGVLGKYSDVPFNFPDNGDPCTATINFTGPSLAELATSAPAAVLAPNGWIALGFIATSDASSVPLDGALFSLRDGTPIVRSALPPGTVVKALQAVNMRPAPAGWGRVVMVIPAGMCVRVSETRTLPAGEVFQTWASGEIADC